MSVIDLEGFRSVVRLGNIEWRKHALEKLLTRGISQQAVIEVLRTGEQIREYKEDQPFPSALFMSYHEGRPLHVVAAFDAASAKVFVITAYEPSLTIFESDFRTKRK